MTPEAAKALADAGPWAVVLFIGAIVAVGGARAIVILWRNHLEADAEDRRQRDDNFLLARDLADGTKRMAGAWEARNRRDERAKRAED